jgi:hypothetical protein
MSDMRMTPARRVALAIGIPTCLAITGYAGLSVVAAVDHGTFPVSQALPAGIAKVTLSVPAGDVLLRQVALVPAGLTWLTGTARYSLLRPTLTARTTSDAIAFNYDCPSPIGDCSLDSTLSVPPGSSTTATTGDGQVTVTGTTGSVTVRTGGGDVTITETTGAVTASSGGGNLTADLVAGDLHLNTDAGNIQAAGITAGSVIAASGGGDIELAFTQPPRDVRVNTNAGNITIVVPAGSTQYDVTASTDAGTVIESVPIDRSSADVITAGSGGGDITIRQAG